LSNNLLSGGVSSGSDFSNNKFAGPTVDKLTHFYNACVGYFFRSPKILVSTVCRSVKNICKWLDVGRGKVAPAIFG